MTHLWSNYERVSAKHSMRPQWLDELSAAYRRN